MVVICGMIRCFVWKLWMDEIFGARYVIHDTYLISMFLCCARARMLILRPCFWSLFLQRHYKVRNGPEAGTFYLSVLDNGVTSSEFWTIVGAADDLSWIVFHYAGAAAAVGQVRFRLQTQFDFFSFLE
jgi:hypothetical protein